jgi:diaminopimelate epimerase
MKLSGAGNDFIIIDNRHDILPREDELLRRFIVNLCRRRISMGADGLLLVENSDVADFRMRYFNSDGSEAETCGNGARCISRFAYANGIAPEKMRFETMAGIYDAEIVGDRVKVRMGDPTGIRLNFPLKLSDGQHIVSFANTGVPHVVFFVEDLEGMDIVKPGRETRYHEEFAPAGTNANFVKAMDRHAMRIRTYERGVEDETLACGTGSIASAIVGALLGHVEPPVEMHTRGGFLLKVYFDLDGENVRDVYLEGDARIICSGELTEEAWDY